MADDENHQRQDAAANAEPGETPDAPDVPEAPETPVAVVGVGVCAASLGSLVALFSGLEPAAPAAYLVAVRQKEGLDVGTVVDALARASAFPVRVAVDGERILAHRVYVGGPDDLLGIDAGRLRVRRAVEPLGQRGTFDSLLISLAEHAHERAVAVILCGLGSEGAAGIVATKKFGGLSIAEAADRGNLAAPGVSDPAAVADLTLPAERIAGEIARYLKNLRPIVEEEEREEAGGALEAQVRQVATILRNVTGHDFHGYKRGTFVRRIHRRMQVMQIEGGLDAYVARLRVDPEEVRHLFQDLLIGVTQFFRDPGEFETLERELPRLFQAKKADDPFRVWVLGCATGEEAYSIAILLREHLATLDRAPEVQIFATDLDARALSLARAGRYADSIAGHVRPDRLERWFVREGETYCVSKELREMCIFSPHNIVKDAPFSRIDILSCRNLLIYLSQELQDRVIPIFHFSLRPQAILFLGSSENITRHQRLFAPVDRKHRVFRRLDTATRVIPDFPLNPRIRGNGLIAAQAPPAGFAGRLPAGVSRQAEAVVERYAPAYVVVDAHGDILHFSGKTGRYLEPSPGAASLSLLNMVHRDLRLDVRAALQRAIADGRRVEAPQLTLRQDDRAFGVTVVVEPLATGDSTTLVVLFQDLGVVPDSLADAERPTSNEHVQRLDAELRVTRDRLQATIEELESTNEELKSSNEEYQSINEELQSANEEMETSKEELQSVNEELQTVNGELGHRVSELARTNSDLKNLLESTQIATVFLDNNLRVRNFTPAATDVFHLLETDVGRPLDHVVSRVAYPELADDARRVLKTLVPIERSVADPATDRHFAARVLPYRSVDNYISGTVVTFTDLTAVRQAEAALRESERRLRALVEGIPQLVWRSESHGRWTWTSPQWTRYTGQAETASHGLGWLDAVHADDREAALAAWAESTEQDGFDVEYRIYHAAGRAYRWFRTRATPVRDARGAVGEWLGTSTDVDEARALQKRQEVLVAELQHRVRNMLTVVRSVFTRTVETGTDLVDIADHFKGRLDALARTQVIVTRSALGTVNLEDLVRDELLSVGVGDGPLLAIAGPDVTLGSKTAEAMGLALHELTTNALKYGALKAPGATLDIGWSVNLDQEGARRLDVVWWEQGVPAVLARPVREGFGRELIEEALPYQLGARTRLEFLGGGVRCSISMPLAPGEGPNETREDG